mmetsp:Transcript_4616/g.13731  ORF Transcript_4616/g.13731 Transcript_4616/m.13731 type:complete len:99 (+) Transcript_4616:99-395(+)
MGSGSSSVQQLIEEVDKGNADAIAPLWEQLGGDGKKVVKEVSKEIAASIDGMDEKSLKRMAKAMVAPFVKARLDPNGDGTISEEEFKKNIMALLNVDE